MATKLTDQIVDKRLIDRNLRKGVLEKKTLEEHMASLKDMADNAESVPYVDPEPEPEVEGEENVEGIEAAPADPAAVPVAESVSPASVSPAPTASPTAETPIEGA